MASRASGAPELQSFTPDGPPEDPPAALSSPGGRSRAGRGARALCGLLLVAASGGCRDRASRAETGVAVPLDGGAARAGRSAGNLGGKWRTARGPAAQSARDLPNLRAIPYLQGYRRAEEHPLVRRPAPDLEYEGLNFYVSGHAAEAVLMDMDGGVLHRWRYPLRRLWPDLAADPAMSKLEYWRRAHLFPNGDLLAIYEGLGVVKLDARSRVLWSYRGGIHHDLDVTGDGEIWLLDRDGKVIPRIDTQAGVFEDMVTVLDRDGHEVRRLSILESFERSAYAGLLAGMPRRGDVFHTNTLEVLDGRFAGRNPAFRKGNLLISVLKLDTIAVIDPERERVVWAMKGAFRGQHQPTFLDDGNLLLFDNVGAGGRRSRILELDPETGAVRWQFGGTAGVDFFSKTLGSCQRLPNGNTLITESENGRALEVTRAGRVVWEFNSPHRAGEQGELVAVLFEMLRLPPDFPYRPGR